MGKTTFKIGKHGLTIEDGKITFHELGARGEITEVQSLYDNTIFWLGAIGYCIEDLAQGPDNIARLTSTSWPDLAIKSRLNTYNEYACMYARHVDYNNFYAVYLYYNYSTSDHRIVKRVGGTFTVLAQEAVDLASGHWYWVLFEVTGTTLESYRAPDPYSDVPASPTISATDSEISNGRWGIRHWGLGLRGLQGLYMLFKQPSSDQKRPQAVFEVKVKGEGTPEDPFMPDLPEKLVEIKVDRVLDPIGYRKLMNLARRYGIEDTGQLKLLAEMLGLYQGFEVKNELACTWSVLIPAEHGKPIDGTAVVRIYDANDKVIEAIKERGAQKLRDDDVPRRVKQLDDRLHEYDVKQLRSNDETEIKKAAKDYIQWRESQFKVSMNEPIAKAYVKKYKGWELL